MRARLSVTLICLGLAVAACVLLRGPARAYWRQQQQLVYTRALVARTAFDVRRRLEEWPSGHKLPAVLCGPGSPVVEGLWDTTPPVRADIVFGHPLAADGWGRCLVLNLDDSNLLRPVWVVSAGPNGRIQTSPDGAGRGGDDIALRVR